MNTLHAVPFIRTFLLILSIVLLQSCDGRKQGQKYNNTNGYEVVVIASAGDQYLDTPYLPLVGNLCYQDKENSVEILVLGKRRDVGDRFYVEAIAGITIKEKNAEKKVVIAVPSDAQGKTIDAENLMDLSVKYGSVKRIIEQWYGGLNGIGSTRSIKWDNKSQAQTVLSE